MKQIAIIELDAYYGKHSTVYMEIPDHIDTDATRKMFNEKKTACGLLIAYLVGAGGKVLDKNPIEEVYIVNE